MFHWHPHLSQLSIHIGYSPRSMVVISSYHKQLDGPFNAPEIIGGAPLTDILRLLLESCISQTDRWSIQCTGDHWSGCFYWHTEIRHIYDVLLDSCISQLFIDVGYSRRSLVVPLSYHKQLNGPFNAPEIIRGATLTDTLRLHIYMIYWWHFAYHSFSLMKDIQAEAWWSPHHITNSQMDHSTHWRSSEGPLWLMCWCYKYIWCTVAILPIIAFQWCRILHRNLSGPLIISQTAGWSCWCTRDHQTGCFDWYTDVTNIYNIWLKSCISQLSSDIIFSTWSLISHSSYHKQPDGPFHAPRITGQADHWPTYQIRKNLNVSRCRLE